MNVGALPAPAVDVDGAAGAARTMSSVVERPRPVPKPGGLVVKNGSKIRARVAASIPAPVSAHGEHDVRTPVPAPCGWRW